MHAKLYLGNESIARLKYKSVANLVDRTMTFDFPDLHYQIHSAVLSVRRHEGEEGHLTNAPVPFRDLTSVFEHNRMTPGTILARMKHGKASRALVRSRYGLVSGCPDRQESATLWVADRDELERC